MKTTLTAKCGTLRVGILLLGILNGLEAAEPPGTAAAAVGSAAIPAKSRSVRENEAGAQERLAPTTPDKLIQRHGYIGSLFSRPERINPLQLINPMAPREYGGTGTPAVGGSWNPMLAPGQAPLPRAFRDDRTHEASAVVVGHSFN